MICVRILEISLNHIESFSDKKQTGCQPNTKEFFRKKNVNEAWRTAVVFKLFFHLTLYLKLILIYKMKKKRFMSF